MKTDLKRMAKIFFKEPMSEEYNKEIQNKILEICEKENKKEREVNKIFQKYALKTLKKHLKNKNFIDYVEEEIRRLDVNCFKGEKTRETQIDFFKDGGEEFLKELKYHLNVIYKTDIFYDCQKDFDRRWEKTMLDELIQKTILCEVPGVWTEELLKDRVMKRKSDVYELGTITRTVDFYQKYKEEISEKLQDLISEKGKEAVEAEMEGWENCDMIVSSPEKQCRIVWIVYADMAKKLSNYLFS